MGVDMRGGQPTPGNIQGGLTTIEEKSLGCIYKGGTAPINGVLDYAEAPKSKGLYVMNTPGQDIESMTGMVAGGAQLVVFTTGRGTPTGNPIAPVIKVTGNPKTFKNMQDNIDINAGTIIEGSKTVQQIGESIFSEILEVINGKQTKAESLKHREFGILKLISTF
jgi:altronate dehydratase large subunit